MLTSLGLLYPMGMIYLKVWAIFVTYREGSPEPVRGSDQ